MTTIERKIAEAIWSDLDGRAGFGLSSLESDDPKVYEEIMQAHSKIVHDALAEINPIELLDSWQASVMELLGRIETAFATGVRTIQDIRAIAESIKSNEH